MRLLFEMDKRDYDNCTHRFVRNSARSIIIRKKKIAMIHSLKYDYYKFPGGGMEGEESPVRAMIRETREEAGLVVRPDTVKEYGYVHRIQKSDKDATECFVQPLFCGLSDFSFCLSISNRINITNHIAHAIKQPVPIYQISIIIPAIKGSDISIILFPYALHIAFSSYFFRSSADFIL